MQMDVSDAGSTSQQQESAKRPKLQRACDLCRKKKSDGQDMPNNRCSKCISYGIECTYDTVNKRPPTKSYVEVLENRLQKMEKLFDQLQSQGQSPPEQRSDEGSTHPSPQGDTTAQIPANGPPAPTTNDASSPSDADDLDPSDDEMEASRKLFSRFNKMSIRGSPMRYHGKSSSMMLLNTAIDVKDEYTGGDTILDLPKDGTSQAQDDHNWTVDMMAEELPPHTDFPPPDLLQDLMDYYFNALNLYAPILHRPTLEQGIKDGLHLQYQGFGAVLLMVCANGSRWSDDPRIEQYSVPGRPGWKWFQQIERARRSLFAAPRLYDLQLYTLMSEYLGGFSSPHSCWSLAGIGIRIALDVGAHRKKTYANMSKVEGELWKRAFWCLLTLDRVTSFSLGRPCAIHDEDVDVDPCIEVDDEYWFTGDPETDFKQPPGKPSQVTFLNTFNSLLQITAFASRTIYSINKSKLMLGFVGQEWEERIVAELDSALNKWIDSVPDHLRWDPTRENVQFMNQSSVLYAKYYQLQIFVHRPFLPYARKSSRLSLPSLAICTNAARSCVHVVDTQYKRNGIPLLYNRLPLFTAGIVLLMNLWGGKRAGFTNQSAATDVQKCIDMMKRLEPRIRSAGRLRDVLENLYSAGDFEAQEPTPSRKRGRDSDEPGTTPSSNDAQSRDTSPVKTPVGATPLADGRTLLQNSLSPHFIGAPYTGTGPGPAAQWANPGPNPGLTPGAGAGAGVGAGAGAGATASFSPPPSAQSALPVHTDELGRVPFHHGFSPFFDPAFAQKNPPPVPAFPNGTLFQSPAHAQAHVPGHPAGAHAGSTAHCAPYPMTGYSMSSLKPEPYKANHNPGYASMSSAAVPMGLCAGRQFSGGGASPGPPAATYGADPGLFTNPLDPGFAAATTDVPGLSMDDIALADNTLEIWSSAPTSIDWADWNTFIDNVSGGDAAVPDGPLGHGDGF
ncbi:fungal-specific transcription factor domain-containing protein [Trametes elegans]|nr:fungal-specific transcription factor domain-containing protein [Trametes elegans]